MIFVSVGTQKQNFSRIFELVNESRELKDEEKVFQTGHTAFKCEGAKIISFMSLEEIKKYIENSSIVICHGGVGSIFDALKLGKKVLALPRLHKFR
ncbi:MAG: glycosyltransferase [Clostridia bacterium]